MAMVIVKFDGPLPVVGKVVRELSAVTGLLISYQPSGLEGACWQLSHARKGMVVDLIPDEQISLQEFNYGLTADVIFNEWSSYLLGAAEFVLVRLGGQVEYELPEWAGKPWLEVQRTWKSSYQNPTHVLLKHWGYA